MLTDVLAQIFERDLGKLQAEVRQYSNEKDLWKKKGEISNSAGNLTLHLVGNLKHFIGAVLGGIEYVRDRDLEFADVDVSRDVLLAAIDETALAVNDTLSKLTPADLEKQYPINVFGHPMTTEFFVVHLATHLDYHLGQINYHRRLMA
ncbi:MAG TPA: DinB family protein [Pyrinomonadaceae bacterium]|mgnify:CR=1 FL=1|nr:DinB family protein [Chloracidobacterium sp.]MBP9934645.1 DinB family protein [Pyrinomonadaceae bacterium]MBL0240569.1 DinB family protein [Chloracidobacterium sp.]HQX55815.1 DinB family protein [Pyrinomonadaceae bacterium]HQY66862.1 DinB family protein [Pyrinomonadaceae bacterium]